MAQHSNLVWRALNLGKSFVDKGNKQGLGFLTRAEGHSEEVRYLPIPSWPIGWLSEESDQQTVDHLCRKRHGNHRDAVQAHWRNRAMLF